MSSAPNVVRFDTPADVATAAAVRFVEDARKAEKAQRPFSVALSGGSTPKAMYQLLATEFKDKIDWQNVHIFFGDERCVPPEHPESNFRLASDCLLSRIQIPPANIHRMRGEDDPHDAAKSYELELRTFFSDKEFPSLDLVFLGMGVDGHTASLFPNTAALHEQERGVVANWVEKLSQFRITLTAPAINNASDVLFLVTGAEKASTFAAVVNGPSNPDQLPAQMIKPATGSLSWFVSF